MDAEIYCNFTCTPLPAYQKFVNAKIAAVDELAYAQARRTLGLSGKSALCIENMVNVPMAFAEAARSLGPAVAAYVGKRQSKFMDAATTMVGGMISDLYMYRQMLLLDGHPDRYKVLAQMRASKLLPEKLFNLLEELFQYRVQFNETAIMTQRAGHDDYIVERQTTATPFGERVALRVLPSSSHDDDEKVDTNSLVDCGDAMDFLKKKRTTSLPPVPRK